MRCSLAVLKGIMAQQGAVQNGRRRAASAAQWQRSATCTASTGRARASGHVWRAPGRVAVLVASGEGLAWSGRAGRSGVLCARGGTSVRVVACTGGVDAVRSESCRGSSCPGRAQTVAVDCGLAPRHAWRGRGGAWRFVDGEGDQIELGHGVHLPNGRGCCSTALGPEYW